MKLNRLALLLTIAGLSTPAIASQAELRAFGRVSGGALEIHTSLDGAAGSGFAVVATPRDIPGAQARLIGQGSLGPGGDGELVVTYPGIGRIQNLVLELRALYTGAQGPAWTDTVTLPLGGILGNCQVLDFDFANGPDEPVTGEVISDQWAITGLAVAGDSFNGASPDKVIVFDSAAPTGGDGDLATPGYGPGNTFGYGKLLILAENVVDANNDGNVDVPDDDAGGGVITFDFGGGEPVEVCSITVVDIDDSNGSEVRFVKSDSSVSTLPLPNAGDNSVQTLTFLETDVVRMEVQFGGSGGIAEVLVAPCPLVLTFEESTFGKPLGFPAGTWVTDQFNSVGLTVSAANNVPGHPNKAILFDTTNPTGGDGDLITPGYGLDNDTALGEVLILAEDDVDANMDGIVDDPDDEAGGGRIVFDFAQTVTFFGGTVLDVDGTEVDFITVFDENLVPLGVLDLENLGDNSVQVVSFPQPVQGVKRAVLTLGGSGSITRLRWCPEPAAP